MELPYGMNAFSNGFNDHF
jgi:hypothetical protein